MIISLDCETTGVDFFLGAAPYYVSFCEVGGQPGFWRWPVNVLTRAVEPDPAELAEVVAMIADADEIVGQNIKFDIHALSVHIPELAESWPWHKTHDTLLAAHLLGSNRQKDLTSLATQYLGVDIQPYEDAMEEACKKARNMVRHDARLKGWVIANEGRADMPSAGKETWKYDTWLPRQVVDYLWKASDAAKSMAAAGEYQLVANMDDARSRAVRVGRLSEARISQLQQTAGWEYRPVDVGGTDDPGHPWYGVTESYANADAAVTAALWPVMSKMLRNRGLWDIYQCRRKLMPAVFRMERRGVTLSRTRLEDMERDYLVRYEAAGETCLKIAATYDVPNTETGVIEPFKLELAKGSAVNNSMRALCFDLMKLEPVFNTKSVTGAPTLDSKNAMPHYLATLRPQGKEFKFIKSLTRRRERGTTLNYLAAYRRFWVTQDDDTFVLHPSFNVTATDTLRFSSNQPNAQNISKKGISDECKVCDGVSGNKECGLCGGKGYTTENVRKCFGPAAGREWWSLDAKNIELRIPFYEAGETDLIALFEAPDEPPFYGSNHILNFSVIWPELWADAIKKVGMEKAGPYCKKTYADSNYQWTKNGGFAVQYGAVDKADGTGTADRAFHRPGAHAMLKARFGKLETLNRKLINFANKHGYVETMPDKSVDARRGYPLLCTRTEYGKILETVPLSYHVQGTACWCLCQMMVLCQSRLDEWRKAGFDGYMVLNVHDELVFDLPFTPNRGNLGRVLELKALMETVGENLVPRVPVTMGVEYHTDNWGTGETIA